MGASEYLIENNAGYTRWMFTGNITIMMLFLINGVFEELATLPLQCVLYGLQMD